MSTPNLEREGAITVPDKPCSACRRRKIRCSKSRPCSYCAKMNRLCSYQDEETTAISGGLAEAAPPGLQARLSQLEELIASIRARDGDAQSPQVDKTDALLNGQSIPSSSGTQIFQPGSSMHFSCSFWAAMTKGIEDMTCLANDWGSLNHTDQFTLSGVCVGPTDPFQTISNVLPSLDATDSLLKCFFDSVNPLIRVVHEPYFRKELIQYRQGRFLLPQEFETLLLSMIAITVISIGDEALRKISSISRPVAIDKYLHLLKSALDRVHFVRTNKILVLQALLHYLVSSLIYVTM
jgi:hypothetical protein